MTTSPDHSGYLIRDTIFEDNGVGLHLGSSGKHPTFVCRNRFFANNEFPTGGFGIFSDKGAQRVLITYNRFQQHNGAGIFFADRGGRQRGLLIDHNKSVDDWTFATIFGSSRVRLTHNSVRAKVADLAFPDRQVPAIFIGARNDDVVVHRNRVHSASGNGIAITNSGEPLHDPATPTNVAVSKNKVEHAQLVGLHLANGTELVAVTANTALDCQDESLGVKNAWKDDVGVSSSPAGLCMAPTDDDQPDHGKGHHHKKKDPCTCKRNPRTI
jgi:hypothetical protein